MVIPEATLEIADADELVLMAAIQGFARLELTGKDWLVPGIPEAGGDDEAAFDALRAFTTGIRLRIQRRQEELQNAA